ncbi:peptidylprolyl isomerase, partial [Candidatus Kaiserbacteria bacterium]|nr:peptidylprolyl isomerase [Candidatus Kaiserbacteria bacterium]
MMTIKEMTPILLLLGACAVLIGGLAYWLGNGGMSAPAEVNLTEDAAIDTPLEAKQLDTYNATMSNDNNPVAVLETNYGTIEIELFDDTMPITAGNFEKLVKEGYYDGIKFHRVIDGFMIQGGDPNTKTDNVLSYGQGGPGYTIPDEFKEGKLLTNKRGTIAMANSGPESGGSQFFINLVDNTNLDFDKQPLTSKHPVFGQVIAGMDVVDAIGQVAVNPGNNLPLENVVIEKATIRQ